MKFIGILYFIKRQIVPKFTVVENFKFDFFLKVNFKLEILVNLIPVHCFSLTFKSN